MWLARVHYWEDQVREEPQGVQLPCVLGCNRSVEHHATHADEGSASEPPQVPPVEEPLASLMEQKFHFAATPDRERVRVECLSCFAVKVSETMGDGMNMQHKPHCPRALEEAANASVRKKRG